MVAPGGGGVNGRYMVRVGDDGRWHGKYADLGDARAHAVRLSTEGWLGKGQIVDRETGDRESYTDGQRVGRGIVR